MAHKIVRVWVVENSCASHFACTIPDSRVFFEADEYFPIIAADAASHFDERRAQVIEAVLSCPTGSIFLEFDNGRVITSFDYDRERGGVQQWIDY